ILLPFVFADTLSYSVVIGYDNGALSLKDVLLIKASPMPASETGEYKARILSFKGDVLFETAFNVNLEPFYSMPLSKETVKPPQKLTKTTFDLVLPYYANAKSIQILKNNNLLLEIDLSKFSTCNENKVCDGSESLEACPGDCTCGNNVCDANENYMICSSDCPPKQNGSAISKNLFLYFGIGFIILVIIVLFLKRGSLGKSKTFRRNIK
ncbi:hypothetical protein HYX00_00855, partial [Candidatus Woesearchaeota archaeon]|nr:hypothetical protein [Candidatus Woesearchaeota archaeon]